MTAAGPGLTRAPGSWRRFVGALVAFAVVAVGMPAGLIAVARLTLASWHPVPGIGSGDEIRTWLGRELSSSEIAPVLLRVLLAAVWLLWLGLLGSVLSSLVTSRPSLEHLRLPRLSMFDGVGGWIAAGLTALSSFTPRLAEASTSAPPAKIEVVAPAGPVQPAAPRPVTVRAGWAMVEHGESIEMFAARTLGDGSRWPEVWAINQGRVMDDVGTTWSEVWRLGFGWELELPAARPPRASEPRAVLHVVDVADLAPGTLDAPHRNGDAGAPADRAREYVVEDGDSYWRIAEVTLRGELGREPTGAEVLVRTHELIALNAARLGHPGEPHMLHPGDIVHLGTPNLPDRDLEPAGRPVGGHVVVDGESYWSIAEDQLRDDFGREPSSAEALERTNALVEHNAPRLGYDDPTLLRVGDVVAPAAEPDSLEVPSVTPTPVESGETGEGPATGDPETTSSGGADGADEGAGGEDTAATPPRVAPSTSPAPAVTTVPGSVPGSVRRDPVPAAPAGAVVERRPAAAVSSRGSLPSARWLFGSATVSTLGLVGGWVTLRRLQRRRHRWAIGPTGMPAEPVVAADVAAEGDPLVGRKVEFLTALSTSGPAELPVRAVLMNSAAVEVLFVDPVDVLPEGWRPDPAVNGWIHPFEEGAAGALGWLSPATATLGHRFDPGDCEVLLDLRSAGRVAISGDELRVRSLMCSLAWELSASAMGRDVDVFLVGFACSSAEMTARPARRVTVAEAAELVAAAPGDGEPPRVFFVDGFETSAAVIEVIEGCVPGSGNAVVLPIPFDAAVETVHVAAEGRTEWDGFTLEPYGVHPSADGELASTLSAIHIGRPQQGAVATVGARTGGGAPAGPMEDAAFGPVDELDEVLGNGFGGPDDGASEGELRLVAPVPGWASTGAGARVVLRTCGTPAVQGAPSTSSLAVVFLLAEGGHTMHGTEIGELTGYKPKTLSTVFTNESPLLERCDGSLTAAKHVITDHRLLAEQAAAVRAAAAGTGGDDVWLLIDALAAIESAPYGRLPGGKAQRSWVWVDDYPEDVPARAAAERNVVSGALDIAAAWLAIDGMAEAGRAALVDELCRLARLIPYATVATGLRVDTSGRCLIRAAYEVAGSDVTLRDAVVMAARRLVAAGLLEDPGDELADFLEL